MVGVCSYIVKEISQNGFSIDELKVNKIELGFSDIPLIDNNEINKEAIEYLNTLNVKYTLHSPTSDESCGVCVDFGANNKKNLEIMEKCFKIASLLDVKYVVIHGGDINGSYYKSYINTLNQLKELTKLAEDYSIRLVLENLFDNRVGALPHEFSAFLEYDLGITIDVGHANLMSNKYGVNIKDYFRYLRPYIEHAHLHDNFGLKDNHLPLGEGNINWKMVLNELRKCRVKNIILEIRNYYNKNSVLNSIKIASKGYKRRYMRKIYNHLGFSSAHILNFS
ncbi:sugar phosphate isomerase/epimerase family protein [Methanocaldococcus sp.]